MSLNRRLRLAGALVLGAAAVQGCVTATSDSPAARADTDADAPVGRFARLSTSGGTATVAGARSSGPFVPVVSTSVANAVSQPLSAVTPIGAGVLLPQRLEEEHEHGPVHPNRPVPEGFVDPVRQLHLEALTAAPAPSASFDGINADESGCGCIPPDTVGAVGPTQYVQMVNSAIAVYSKTGQTLLAPRNINTLFSALPSGAACRVNNDGDPVVVYDQLADRWMISQFAVPGGAAGYHECMAVSKTPDATGEYYVYDFLVGDASKFQDYPHFGLWPDGYYMATHQFDPTNYIGAGVFAFEREKMLAGAPAKMVYFDLNGVNPAFGGHLPATLDGDNLPPAGTPAFFLEVDDSAEVGPVDAMRVWKFHVDWSNPAASTFGVDGQPNTVVPVADFARPNCIQRVAGCVPQPSYVELDAIGDRLMYRAVYRNFGDHESIVVNHTVVADATTGQMGPRWYELRDPAGTPTIFQQGTLAPSALTDPLYRWMGSIAMDWNGNMAIGYSTSSASSFPSIAYSGRLAGDAPGVMAQSETQLQAGGSGENPYLFVGVGLGRWGDYAAMTVDPVDDCTFWFTSEYFPTPVDPFTTWHTRIGSFKFPSCVANHAPVAALAATPTAGAAPLNVSFDASGSSDEDSGDTVATYVFDFGDGTTETRATPTTSHRYALAGSYTATVRVADNHGKRSKTAATAAVGVSMTPFTFVAKTGVKPSTLIVFGPKTVSGFTGTLPISVSGLGTPQYSINGAPFTSAPGQIAAGASLRVRHKSAAAASTARISTVTVGSYSTKFRSVTQ